MEKYCKWCKQNKPISLFYKSKDRKDGYKEKCKECSKARNDYIKSHRESIILKTEKKCNICKLFKPIEEYGKNKSRHDGLTTYCADCTRQYSRKKQHYKSYGKKWYYSNKEQINKQRKSKRENGGKIKEQERARILKEQIMNNYGGVCVCCGENRIEFLTIDHIKNDGKNHRKEINCNFYNWLKKNNFPKDNFQCLCMNCNWYKGQRGECCHGKDFRENILTNENLY